MGDQEGSALTQDQVRRVVETAINPFCVIDVAGEVLWAGDSMQELLGWPPSAMVGRSMIDFVAPASVAYAVESLATAADYIRSRRDEPSTWEGVGPVIGLLRADGSVVSCAVAVATPVRTALPGFVLQFRRAEAASALEDALVAMGQGDPIESVLGQVAFMLAGELPDVDVTVAHRCTADDQIQLIGMPPGLEAMAEPGRLRDTPWQATVDDPDVLVAHAVDALPEPLRTTAVKAGYHWLTTAGVKAAGPTQHRAFVAVWSRHAYENHVFSNQRIQRCANLVGLVVQWEEGRRALEWAVSHDGLTGLANRSAFTARLERDTSDGLTAVLFLDLDDFKPVNDTHGHALGDRVLALVATRLRHAVRPSDVVARLGGDEFAVLCPAIGDLDAAGVLAERLVDAVADPIVVDGIEVRVGLSVGIAELLEGDDAGQVLDRADGALREAKLAGKRRWVAAS